MYLCRLGLLVYLLVCLLTPAAHGQQLAAGEFFDVDNGSGPADSHFESYPMKRAETAPHAAAAVEAWKEAAPPGYDSYPW